MADSAPDETPKQPGLLGKAFSAAGSYALTGKPVETIANLTQRVGAFTPPHIGVPLTVVSCAMHAVNAGLKDIGDARAKGESSNVIDFVKAAGGDLKDRSGSTLKALAINYAAGKIGGKLLRRFPGMKR